MEKGYGVDTGYFGKGDIFEKKSAFEKQETETPVSEKGYGMPENINKGSNEKSEDDRPLWDGHTIRQNKITHVVLDGSVKFLPFFDNFVDTQKAIDADWNEIATNQPHFASFGYNRRIIVWVNGKSHEITCGACEGTEREIRYGHNIENMIFSGVFDWFC